MIRVMNTSNPLVKNWLIIRSSWRETVLNPVCLTEDGVPAADR